MTPFQKHHRNQFINQSQSGETILNPINKSASIMFLKWGQSDQSVPIGPIIFFYKGYLFHYIIWYNPDFPPFFSNSFLPTTLSTHVCPHDFAFTLSPSNNVNGNGKQTSQTIVHFILQILFLQIGAVFNGKSIII